MKQSNSPNQQELEAMIRSIAGQLGTDPNTIRSSVQKGSPEELMKKLSPKDAEMLQKTLADKETTARVLASPQAQELMRRLMERK